MSVSASSRSNGRGRRRSRPTLPYNMSVSKRRADVKIFDKVLTLFTAGRVSELKALGHVIVIGLHSFFVVGLSRHCLWSRHCHWFGHIIVIGLVTSLSLVCIHSLSFGLSRHCHWFGHIIVIALNGREKALARTRKQNKGGALLPFNASITSRRRYHCLNPKP